jgi:hypothetical protein
MLFRSSSAIFPLRPNVYADQNFAGHGPPIELRGQKLPLLQRLNRGLRADVLRTDGA